MLLLTVWTSQGAVFGGTSMDIFDEADSLKQGKQKLVFYFDEPGNCHLNSLTRGGQLYDRYVIFDVVCFLFCASSFKLCFFLMNRF